MRGTSGRLDGRSDAFATAVDPADEPCSQCRDLKEETSHAVP
jgi:hypothetical protein